MKTNLHNPYVGPRVFQKEEGYLFFGRERETADLTGLVVSEQLLLFYAQSGAGKSSLINARIIPELEASDFEVLPVGRVSGDPFDAVEPRNLYLYNLERSLAQQAADLEALSNLSLTNFLGGWERDVIGYSFNQNPKPAVRYDEDMPRRRVLIIDQFEEFFSMHAEAWEQREGFIRELAQAMQDHPDISVVLVMREDYVASLDPYAHLLPGRTRMRYYMQRLSREAALDAIKRPVAKLRPYAEGVAERLVDDLCSIIVQKPDGTYTMTPGQYVEPVQLQVVCYSLWENLSPEAEEITVEHLRDVGDVNQSLGRYYADRVATVAQAKNIKERLIRDWFEHQLITAGGMRNLVLQEPDGRSGGLPDDVIQAFQSDLVRAEKRSGATFYELTHDRLVEPILADNRAWRRKNASILQQQAALWEQQGQGENLLLRGQALAEVEKWAQANLEELTGIEKMFLQQSRMIDARQKRELQQRKLISINAILATFLLVVSILLAFNMRATGSPGVIYPVILFFGTLLLGFMIGRYWRR